jgi:hypothetical protein
MQFPDRTAEIQIHREAARRYWAAGDFASARSSYNKWVESVKQQNINKSGQLESDLNEAKKEFSEFVNADPLYHQISAIAITKIRETPGILQTDLYKALSSFDKADITYVLYFADDHGSIVRTKKGRTYSLSLP